MFLTGWTSRGRTSVFIASEHMFAFSSIHSEVFCHGLEVLEM